jgi:hypothetical protein
MQSGGGGCKKPVCASKDGPGGSPRKKWKFWQINLLPQPGGFEVASPDEGND